MARKYIPVLPHIYFEYEKLTENVYLCVEVCLKTGKENLVYYEGDKVSAHFQMVKRKCEIQMTGEL